MVSVKMAIKGLLDMLVLRLKIRTSRFAVWQRLRYKSHPS